MSNKLIESAKEKFGIILEEQLARVEAMKKSSDALDFSKISPIVIGVCFGFMVGN